MENKRYGMSKILVLVMVILGLTGCQSTQDVSYGPKIFSEKQSTLTAIVVAYEPEMLGVLSRIESDENATIKKVETFNGIQFHIGHYNDEPIVLFATGMSIANAALSMQMAFDYFPIKQVVYMGIAGAVNPAWQPGDVIVPARWYYHDESVYTNPDKQNPGKFILPTYYAKGLAETPNRRKVDPHVPNYQNFHFIQPDEVLVIKDGMDKPVNTPYFSASPRLLSAAEKAIANLPEQMILEQRKAKLHVGGNGVTGSVFLDNREYRKWTREVFNAEVTEMESAAVGQVSFINNIDWVIIRAISDLAGGQEGVNVEHIYDKEVSRVGANVLFAVLDELASK